MWNWFPLCLAAPACLLAGTREVGPGKQYKKPCDAAAAARSGDVILICPGDYNGDACEWKQDRLVIRIVPKAIWVIRGRDVVVENLEFTGARSQDKNGAGIRPEGRNFTVRYCYFHHNENGILTAPDPSSEIVIEYSEFAYNGAGDGFSHNLYIGRVGRLVMRFCYSHHAREGHLLKSRAAENRILYNRLTDQAGGQASYELDFPNGGTSYVIGNLIQQSESSPNGVIVAYQLEGRHPDDPDDHLYLVDNTIVNQRASGVFLKVGDSVVSPATIFNDIFYGPGTLVAQKNAVMRGNLTGADPLFRDGSRFDYRIKPVSPAVDLGENPGSANGFRLEPIAQYVHTACGEDRPWDGKPDAGAYELDPNRLRAQNSKPCGPRH